MGSILKIKKKKRKSFYLAKLSLYFFVLFFLSRFLFYPLSIKSEAISDIVGICLALRKKIATLTLMLNRTQSTNQQQKTKNMAKNVGGS